MSTEPHKRTTTHTWFEDAQAFVLGTALCALAVQFLTHTGLITGQTAGLGVLLSYASGAPFGLVFFAVNLPFYVLAWLRMGVRFTLRTFLAVVLVSLFAELFPLHLTFAALHPALSACLAGACAGMGLIVLFRHGASLGGIGVLGLMLQERLGIQAGWVQLGFDAALFMAALFILPDPRLVAWSLLGAVITNFIVAQNHRQDRYIGR